MGWGCSQTRWIEIELYCWSLRKKDNVSMINPLIKLEQCTLLHHWINTAFSKLYAWDAYFFGCNDLVSLQQSAGIHGWWSAAKADISSANLLWIPAESAPNFSNDVRYQPGSSLLSCLNSNWVMPLHHTYQFF